MTEPTVRATRYEVSCVPPDHALHRHMALHVVWRGGDQWAVTQPWEPAPCLGADGEWEYEPHPSERTDEWKAAHRFDLDTALDLAKREAPKLTVRGRTAAQWLAEEAST